MRLLGEQGRRGGRIGWQRGVVEQHVELVDDGGTAGQIGEPVWGYQQHVVRRGGGARTGRCADDLEEAVRLREVGDAVGTHGPPAAAGECDRDLAARARGQVGGGLLLQQHSVPAAEQVADLGRRGGRVAGRERNDVCTSGGAGAGRRGRLQGRDLGQSHRQRGPQPGCLRQHAGDVGRPALGVTCTCQLTGTRLRPGR